MPKATARIVPPSWRPSFDFSMEQPPSISEVPTVSVPTGEGLGGGYCTPPNQKSGERSELIDRGSGRSVEARFCCVAVCGASRACVIVVTIWNNYLQGYKDLGGVRCAIFSPRKGVRCAIKKGVRCAVDNSKCPRVPTDHIGTFSVDNFQPVDNFQTSPLTHFLANPRNARS